MKYCFAIISFCMFFSCRKDPQIDPLLNVPVTIQGDWILRRVAAFSFGGTSYRKTNSNDEKLFLTDNNKFTSTVKELPHSGFFVIDTTITNWGTHTYIFFDNSPFGDRYVVGVSTDSLHLFTSISDGGFNFYFSRK